MKRFLALAFGLLMIAAEGYATGNPAKISPELLPYTNSTQQVPVIIQYSSTNNCTGLLGVVDCLVQTVQQLGGVVIQRLPLLNDVVALVDGTGILKLSGNSNVLYISTDRKISNLMSDDAVAVNAPVAWQSNLIGNGIGVAVIDSGINSHPDLNSTGLLPLSRVGYNQSFITGDHSTLDAYGHGTHVAGLIAGNGASSTGKSFTNTFKGIAPGARLVNLRVLGPDGSGSDSAVIAAIHQAISLKNLYNIRVINLSLGRAVYESYKLDPLCQAVEKAWKSGIVVVVASGNYGRYEPTGGYATISAPGNDPYVITVGAMKTMGTQTRSDDLLASYSSKGPSVIDHIVKPDIVAPGNLEISTQTPKTSLYVKDASSRVPYSSYVFAGSSQPSTSYLQLSGTSMATGVVSGVVADLLQAHPTLTPDQVKARLMKTASKTFPSSSTAVDPASGGSYVSYYDMFSVGAGYVDLAAALVNTDVAKGNAMSPMAVYDATTGSVHIVPFAGSVWGTSSAWSDVAVYGPVQFSSLGNGTWSSATVAGSSVMWGANTSSGFSTIWSNSVMWGASGDYGSSVMWGANVDGGE